MAIVFVNFWTRTICAQSTHLLATAAKRGMGMELVNTVRNDFICCHKSLLPSVVSCRVLDEVELSENTRVDHRALAVSFSQLHVSVSNQ